MPKVDWNQGTSIHTGNGGGRRIYRVGSPASDALSYPFFYGTDPNGWVFRAEGFFDVNLMPENEKLEAAILSMEGEAIAWFQWDGWRLIRR